MKRIISLLLSTMIVLSVFLFSGKSAMAAEQNDVSSFVTRMYSVCLDREPDPAGLNDWTSKLVNHEATGVSAAYGFIFSGEFQNKQCTNEQYVTYMYSAFFGRTPDPDGLNTWVTLLNNGASREFVFCGFANSVEFDNLCKSYGIIRGFHIEGQNFVQVGMVNLFVERLYNEVLGRSCDSQGMADWTTLLVNRTYSGSQVAAGFVFSEEFTNKHLCNSCYLDTLYQAFMGRSADSAGKSTWMELLNNGMSREDVFNGFAGSAEFNRICDSYGISNGTMTFVGAGTYASGSCTRCGVVNPIITPAPSNTSNSSNPGTSGNSSSSNPTPSAGNGNVSITPTATPTPTSTPEPYHIESRYGFTRCYDNDGVMQKGWIKLDDNWYYFSLYDGDMYTGWHVINDSTYYFNSNGVMKTGWLKDNSHWYFFNLTSGKMSTGWVSYNDKWYYFNDDGRMVYGEQTIKGKDYYFDETNGNARTGWVKGNFDEYYYYDPDSYVRLTGWLKYNGSWYYLSPEMAVGIVSIKGSSYCFDEDGKMVTGWVDRGYGEWSYFEPSTGKQIRNQWYEINNVIYHFDDWGYLDTKKYVDGYWVDKNGHRKTGWIHINDGQPNAHWEYLDPVTHTLATGWREIDGKIYHFGYDRNDGINDNVMNTGLTTLMNGSGHLTTYYFGEDGAAQKGMIEIDGILFYYGDNYERCFHEWVFYNGNWYFIDSFGMVSKDTTIMGYYCGPDGICYDYPG
ncbi:MAG: DUF4214 domain-containing protein [Saccharofermentans sp.]|nr:DUF4214 domain-containing protein [Saccharofermentans sp.]